jgi:hypothetical protein
MLHFKRLAPIALAGFLTACGGSSSNNGDPNANPMPVPTQVLWAQILWSAVPVTTAFYCRA